MAENKKRAFLVHGGILAMAGIIVRIIGMFYRIPLVNIIGSEGNGIYSVAFNVYNVMLVLSSYSMPMAVSKLVSAHFAKKEYRNANQIFRCSFLIAICSGGTAALLLYFGADLIESMYKGVSGVSIPLRVLAPTIFFVAVMGVMRGFYQGQGTMIPTAFSQLIEQIINAIVSIVAAYMLVKAYSSDEHVAAYGAAGGTLGTAMGAFAGLLFLMIIYLLYKPTFSKMVKKDCVSVDYDNSECYKLIIATMIPIILSQTLYQISSVIDDVMFSNIMLQKNYFTSIESDLGNFSSSYNLLVGIPQGVASAMSASMLPSIVVSYSLKDRYGVRTKINQTIKTNMFIAIPSFVGLFVLGEPIIKLLFARYDSVQGGMMLKLGAIAVVFYTLSTVTSSALQGINKMKIPVRNAIISLVIHIILVFGLLSCTDIGIYALVIGNATFPVLILVLNIAALKKYAGYRLEIKRNFVIPSICAIIMGIASFLTYKFVYEALVNNTIALFAAFLMAFVTYFVPVILFKKKGLY